MLEHIMAASVGWRVCIICRHAQSAVSPKCLLLTRAALSPVYILPSTSVAIRRLCSSPGGGGGGSGSKSLQPSSRGLSDPLDPDASAPPSSDALERRSADPNNELRDYIEYSKVNSWHAAVGRRTPGKQRWKYERIVIGVCFVVFMAYVYIRPENSVDEQFGMDEFGKGLFRPHPAMEHHIAATIQTVESRGGDASLYRNQLKTLLKEKELENQRRQQTDRGKGGDVKYDPRIHDVKY